MNASPDIVRRLLWLGVEDFTGLWDARAEVADALGLVDDMARARAASILASMAQEGWVEVLRGPDALDDGALRNVAPPELADVFDEPSAWCAPESAASPVVKFTTTEAGLAHMRELEKQDGNV